MAQAEDGSRRLARPAGDRTDLDAIEWFYRQQGMIYGPMTSLDLHAAARLGFLGPRDEVMRRGQDTWICAGSVCWLFKPRMERS